MTGTLLTNLLTPTGPTNAGPTKAGPMKAETTR